MKAMLVVDRCKRFKARCTGGKSLPQSVRTKKALLSIQNIPTDQWFLYTVAAGLAKMSCKPQCSSLYRFIVRNLEEETGISDRVGEKEIKHFEKNCDISVNVYTYEGGVTFPFYMTSSKDKSLHVDLFLYAHHYYMIRNISTLIGTQSKKRHSKVHICQYCLSSHVCQKRYEDHMMLCRQNLQKMEF